MKQIIVIFAAVCLGLVTGAQLSTRYLPPNHAGTSGGHGSFLQGPRPQSRPSNQYLAPRPSNAHYHGVSGGAHYNAGPAASAQGSHRFGQNRGGAQIPILRNEYTNDGSGNYNFGFETGNGIQRDETGRFEGGWPHGSLDVKGSYSYTGDDGHVYTVNYKADSTGFHPEGDHLPTPPPIPREIQESLALHHGGRGGSGGGRSHYGGGASAPSAQYLPPHQQQSQHSGSAQGYHYGRRYY